MRATLAIACLLSVTACSEMRQSMRDAIDSAPTPENIARHQAAADAQADARHAAERAAAASEAERDRVAWEIEQRHAEDTRMEAMHPPSIEEQIANQRRCVSLEDAAIARESAIGREVGYVDMRALHDAAAAKLSCKARMVNLQACLRAPGPCAADAYREERERKAAWEASRKGRPAP